MNDIVCKSIRLNFNCPNCSSHTFDVRKVGPHYGAYCVDCGSYVKWLSKIEKRDCGIVSNQIKLQDFKDELHHYDIEDTEVPW